MSVWKYLARNLRGLNRGKELNMKISVVIPFMAIDEGKYQVLEDTVKSFRGADEIITVWNDGMGYAKPINLGLRMARGEYLVVMNDDLDWGGGNLDDLCDPSAVTSPTVNGKEQEFWGCAFCLPRWAYEKTGGMYEGYEISYFDDDDFWMTLKKLDIPRKGVTTVNVKTAGGRTLRQFSNRDEFFAKNKTHFEERWS